MESTVKQIKQRMARRGGDTSPEMAAAQEQADEKLMQKYADAPPSFSAGAPEPDIDIPETGAET